MCTASCVQVWSAKAEIGTVPVVVPVDPPAGVAGTEDSATPLALAERTRPARAKRPREIVPAAVPIEVETAPITVPIPLAPVPMLTPREAQLLAALAADPGASSAALGSALGIAAGTVRKALGALRAKLGAGPDADGATLVALVRAPGLLVGEVVSDGGYADAAGHVQHRASVRSSTTDEDDTHE